MNSITLLLRALKIDLVWRAVGMATLAVAGALLVPSAAFAHHPFGGETPKTFLEGFLSGLGHPVIGLDHFAFVVAVGLLAAAVGRGLFIPMAFVATSLVGTGIHLLALDLPALELIISASVLGFGILLALKDQPRSAAIAGAAAIAGIFHGYAYGEAIVGAEMTPLAAYLLGFTLVQGAIAAAAYGFGCRICSGQGIRFAGFTLTGIGVALLAAAVG